MPVVTDTRNRLLTATNESFRRRGYNGTSLKHVTKAARAPTGSLYHFFPGGKDELASEVITTSGAAYRELFEAIGDAADSPGAAVTDFFDGAAAVLEETDFIDPCPIGTVAREVASTNEPLRVATEGVFSSWIESAATRMAAAGVARAESERLAITIVAALEGGFVLARAKRDANVLRAAGVVMRRVVEAAIRVAVVEPA
jgi:AcrR family transcriptional regulator